MGHNKILNVSSVWTAAIPQKKYAEIRYKLGLTTASKIVLRPTINLSSIPYHLPFLILTTSRKPLNFNKFSNIVIAYFYYMIGGVSVCPAYHLLSIAKAC